MTKSLPLSVCIPTYGRNCILLDTIKQLLLQEPRAIEILIIDQTEKHDAETEKQLGLWDREGAIRWIHRKAPSQPGALNDALQASNQDFALFLDDDIRIDPAFLQAHMDGFASDEIWAVAGQVLQPDEQEDEACNYRSSSGSLVDIDFPFKSGKPRLISNGMSGNLCVRRERAVQIKGFDENFIPPVAYRFDNEFCLRLCQAGGKIQFMPSARIDHLRASRGGTRSNSNHLTSFSPEHGVGDYYFALRCAKGFEKWRYLLKRPFREIRTRFHLKHPWWIPIKFLGEVRGLWMAFCLNRRGPRYIDE